MIEDDYEAESNFVGSPTSALKSMDRERWEAMGEALARHLPQSATTPSFGGTSYWLRGPEGLDAEALARAALEAGVVIEPGTVHFHAKDPPRNTFRLGFSSIPAKKLTPASKNSPRPSCARGEGRKGGSPPPRPHPSGGWAMAPS